MLVNKKGRAYSEFASGAYVPSLSDTVDLPKVSSGGLLITGLAPEASEDIKILTVDNDEVVINTGNTHLKIIVKRVFLTGTSPLMNIYVLV